MTEFQKNIKHFSSRLLQFTVAALMLYSCSYFQEAEIPDEAVARVEDKFLYLSEIQQLMSPNVSKEDSTEIATNYINKWIEEELLLSRAKLNLGEEQKNVERQIEAYRKSLLIYAYEQQVVEQLLDTVVSLEDIEAYYAEHQNDFELKDYIVKVVYVKLSPNAPKIKKVKEWILSNQEKDRNNLLDYCRQFADNFYLNDATWLYFDDLLKEVPLEVYNIDDFLRSKKMVEFSDENNIYMLRIVDFRLKNSISPMVLEKENIRNIILNQRKLKLISEMVKDIYQDASGKNLFEIIKK